MSLQTQQTHLLYFLFGENNEWHRKTQNIRNQNNTGRNIPEQQMKWKCRVTVIIDKGERWGMFNWPHWGGTEVTSILGTWLGGGYSNLAVWDNLNLKTNHEKENTPVLSVYVLITKNVFGSWRKWVFGSDADRQKSKGVCRRLSGSVVGDPHGSENEPKEGASLGRWADEPPAHPRLSFRCRDPRCWSSGPGSAWSHRLPESDEETHDRYSRRVKI